MIRLGWQTVVLRRREVVGHDDYGNDIHAVVETPIERCAVQPRTSTEDNNGRLQVISGVTLLAPADPLITPSDVINIEGRRYEVVGDPGVWQAPNGVVAYQQVALRRVTG